MIKSTTSTGKNYWLRHSLDHSLQQLYQDVLSEPVPNEMLELLQQLSTGPAQGRAVKRLKPPKNRQGSHLTSGHGRELPVQPHLDYSGALGANTKPPCGVKIFNIAIKTKN